MNVVQMKKARFWLLMEIAGMAVIVYVFKIAAPWSVLLILIPVISFAWERFCDIADDIGAMRDDISVTRRLFETVVNAFVTVRLDKEHDFNFVMDMVAEQLHQERTKH
jgi:hypothetical protein